MGEESVALVAQKGLSTMQCMSLRRGDFRRGNLNLLAVVVGVLDGSAVDDAIEAGPERGAHAHGAGLAGGVERVAGERKLLEVLGGEADGADLGVGAGVELAAPRR